MLLIYYYSVNLLTELIFLENTEQFFAVAFNEDVSRCILSNPLKGAGEYRRIVIEKTGGKYRVEKYTEKQVFHSTLGRDEAYALAKSALGREFRQLNSWDSKREHMIRISSKGKPFYSHRAAAGEVEISSSHNREKNYILKEGTDIAPLRDMGVFTSDGRVVSSMQDKYRQINRFVEMVDDEVSKMKPGSELRVIDFGCGKSYLTFVLYYYFTHIKGLRVRMTGLDLKKDVIEKCSAAAEKYGYDGLNFELGDINGYTPDGDIDMVVTLHACDTATDYALYNAVKWNSKLIFSVPCCQHELNSQMKSKAFGILTRYGIVKERTAALMTDAVRANLLEACGYKTQLMEFVDLEHTPKNILIRAVRRQSGHADGRYLDEVKKLCGEFSLEPTLLRLLEADGFGKTITRI